MPGASIALIGPSGSAKSTLIRCIALLHPIRSGSIEHNGQLVADGTTLHADPDLFRRQIGLVHQEWNLWPNKTVIANLTEAPRFVLGMDRSDAMEEARRWLAKMDLPGFEDRYPGELSGGQKQRVAIARALMLNPQLIMFDEITSALDVESTDRLLRLLESLREGRNFIFVSHHLDFVQRATTQTCVIVDGEIVESGPSADVILRPTHPVTAQFLSTVRAIG